MKTPKFDHCVLSVSSWERSDYFYENVLGAERVPLGNHWAYRFGHEQLHVHGPGHEGGTNPRIADSWKGGDLCFSWPGSIEDAIAHLALHRIPIEVGPVKRIGCRGEGRSVYFRDPDGSLLEFISYANDL